MRSIERDGGKFKKKKILAFLHTCFNLKGDIPLKN